MEIKERGRDDAATSKRPAAERPFKRDQLNPQHYNITEADIEQDEYALDYETETSIVRQRIAEYQKPLYKKLPEKMRWRYYEEGKSRFVELRISPAAKDYGYRLLAGYLEV